jgi:RNA polymerase sigma-70 factor, ECF subfamily
MLMNDSRRNARFRGDGELVLLDDQDRSLWNLEQIDDSRQLLERALALQGGGPYVLQAVISDLHAREPRDWEQIALLYEQLEPDRFGRGRDEPCDRDRRGRGPDAALAILEPLDLDDYRYYHSTRADFLRQLGRDEESRTAYGRALELTQTESEWHFLETRLTELDERAEGESHESRIDLRDADATS